MLNTDETATLAAFKSCLNELLSPLVREHRGRIVKTMGDGVLAEFASAFDALICAVAFQQAMAERNAGSSRRMDFRIGVNAGDAVLEDGDVFGETVAIAARLEKLAPPGGVCVSARVREDALGRGDLAFEDAGEHYLKNIERPVRVFCLRLDASASLPLPLPDKPSIAVLPFENLSGDREQDYFADGLSEDIISALSRWRWFFVIARNSSFAYRGRAADAAKVGRDLGVRYLLEGSVRRAGQRIRVGVQLIDTNNATHIWSEIYDRDLTDIFALHDEITEHVVTAIEPAMLHHEGMRASHIAAADLNAFDCFQRGMWHLNKVSAEDFRKAEELFREAIRLDPGLALGRAGLARTLYGRAVYGWSADAMSDFRAAEEAARAAITLDAREATAHFALSGALLYLGRHAEALKEAERTLSLNPNFAFGHFRLGQVLIYCGRANEAVAPLERSIRLNPFDPQMSAMLSTLALAQFHAGDYAGAAARAAEAARGHDKRAPLIRAASLARLGIISEAHALLTPSLRARAAALIGGGPYARRDDVQDFFDALRLAGFDDLSLRADLDEAANSAIASDSGWSSSG